MWRTETCARLSHSYTQSSHHTLQLTSHFTPASELGASERGEEEEETGNSLPSPSLTSVQTAGKVSKCAGTSERESCEQLGLDC